MGSLRVSKQAMDWVMLTMMFERCASKDLPFFVGIPYFVGRYGMDEAPAEVPDYLFAFGFGLSTILRYPLEVLGLVG
jgi:hypothetical protein